MENEITIRFRRDYCELLEKESGKILIALYLEGSIPRQVAEKIFWDYVSALFKSKTEGQP